MAAAFVCRVRENPLPKQRPTLATKTLCQQASRQGQDRPTRRSKGQREGAAVALQAVLWVQKLVLKGANQAPLL